MAELNEEVIGEGVDAEGEELFFLHHHLVALEAHEPLTERDEMLQPGLAADALLHELVEQREEGVALRHIDGLVLPGQFSRAEERLNLHLQPALVVEYAALGELALKHDAELGNLVVDFITQITVDERLRLDALFPGIPVVGIDGEGQTARCVDFVADGEAHIDSGGGGLVTALGRYFLEKS